MKAARLHALNADMVVGEIPSSLSVPPSLFSVGGDVEEVLSVARQEQLITRTERFPLTSINGVFSRLERGGILGRAVLVPCENSNELPT
jgi:D-arabinose 1-dehydrogenase-like Zn-dependent alcohol dehydrogenase